MSRALFVAPWGTRVGGAERMLEDLVARLPAQGITPGVVLLEPGPFAAQLRALGVSRVETIAAGRLRDLGRYRAAVGGLARVLRDFEPDVLVDWIGKVHFYGYPAHRLARSRSALVWWQHGIPGAGPAERLLGRLPADAIGCSSEAIAERQRRRSPRTRLVTIHPGVARPGPEPAPARDERPFVIGSIGRMQRWKGHDVLVAATERLVGQGRDVRLVLVGGVHDAMDDGYADQLRARVAAGGLGDRVVFTGEVGEARGLLPGFDVFASAAEAEPFGIAIVEAMQAGLPVVAVDAGGPREIVEHDRTGFLVPTGDAAAFAERIGALMDDPVRRAAMGEAGERRAHERFGVDRMVAEVAGFIGEVAR